MNIYHVFTAFTVVLIHLLQTNDRRALAPLLDAPEYDCTYSISYIIIPPYTPLTIDPSPPFLIPLFDPNSAPVPPHTFTGATSTVCDSDTLSVDWATNVLMVVISGLLVHEIIPWLAICTRGKIFNTVRDHPQSRMCPASVYPPPPLPSFLSLNDDSLPKNFSTLPIPNTPATFPGENSDGVILSAHSICASAPSSIATPVISSAFVQIDSDTTRKFSASSPRSHSSSFPDEKDDNSEVLVSSNYVNSSISTGFITSTAARSVQNTLLGRNHPPPSPSFSARIPPAVSGILGNLWEKPVHPDFNDKPSVWDCYPQAAPRTPVDLDDETIEIHDDSAENYAQPLIHTSTMNVDETPVTLASIAKESGTVERAVESTGSSRSSVPVRSARIPRFAPTLAWKKSINALISGEEGKSTRRVPIQTSATSADVISSVSCLSTSSKLNAPKEIGWFDDVENSLFTSMNVSAEEVEVTSDVRNGEQVVKSYGRIFEECDCALEAALFNPKSWKKFKIPASCHSRPPIHFFAPRDTDALNPSIRIVVDNVNAFHHHSVEPNVPYANQDVEMSAASMAGSSEALFDTTLLMPLWTFRRSETRRPHSECSRVGRLIPGVITFA